MINRAHIILKLGHRLEFHTCAFLSCTSGEPDLVIPKMTGQEAEEAGWITSTDVKYCPPDEDVAYICPECAKEIGLDKHKDRTV